MLFDNKKVFFCVVESELDGILLQENVRDLVNIIALGSANIRPDEKADIILRHSELILNALDADEAGAKQVYNFWEINYKQNRRWLTLEAKDVSEMFEKGKFSLRTWILAGFDYYGYRDPSEQKEEAKTEQIKVETDFSFVNDIEIKLLSECLHYTLCINKPILMNNAQCCPINRENLFNYDFQCPLDMFFIEWENINGIIFSKAVMK